MLDSRSIVEEYINMIKDGFYQHNVHHIPIINVYCTHRAV